MSHCQSAIPSAPLCRYSDPDRVAAVRVPGDHDNVHCGLVFSFDSPFIDGSVVNACWRCRIRRKNPAVGVWWRCGAPSTCAWRRGVAGGGWWRCSAPLAYAWRRGIEYRLLPIPKLIPAEGAAVGGMDDGGGGDMFGRSGGDDDEIEREMGRWSLGKRRENGSTFITSGTG
jgi:hypothetical protein